MTEKECICDPDVRYGYDDRCRVHGHASKSREHKVTKLQLRCVCAGQGESTYSARCPVHDPSVDTTDATWRKWYDEHLEQQKRIKEKLGW